MKPLTFDDRSAHAEVASSEEIDVPMGIGPFRPGVPISAAMLLDDRKCVWTHEPTHVRRANPAWNLILKLACWLCWFHRLVHLSRRRITDVHEQIFDSCRIHLIGRPICGLALSDMAKRMVVAALFVSTFPVYQAQASSFANPIQGVSEADDAEMWNFNAGQKKIFAELLQKGVNEVESVEEKIAILTLIRDENNKNFAQLKSWSGTYKKVYDDLREDGTHRQVVEGRFVIAPPLDSIMSVAEKGEISLIENDGTEQLVKNTHVETGQWISTPEHVLSRTLPGGQGIIHRNSRIGGGDTARVFDPRDWLGPNGWTTADFLSAQLEHAQQEGYWDRASLSATNTDSGVVYTYELIFGRNGLGTASKETLAKLSFSFSESAGYLMSHRSTTQTGWRETVRLEHKKENGIHLPFRCFEKHRMRVDSGDVGNREKTIELVFTGVNKELPSDAFDIARFEPVDNDILLDDLNGKTMSYRNGQFREIDRKSIVFNGNPTQQWPEESSDWQYVQSAKTYKFRLIADRNGGLEEIIGSGGLMMSHDGRPETETTFKTAQMLATKLRQTAEMTGTGIAQHFTFTLIPDASMNRDEVEKIKKELSFEMMFADGTMKTVPSIVVGPSE